MIDWGQMVCWGLRPGSWWFPGGSLCFFYWCPWGWNFVLVGIVLFWRITETVCLFLWLLLCFSFSFPFFVVWAFLWADQAKIQPLFFSWGHERYFYQAKVVFWGITEWEYLFFSVLFPERPNPLCLWFSWLIWWERFDWNSWLFLDNLSLVFILFLYRFSFLFLFFSAGRLKL